ncbi:FtsX-like permease family protein [Flavobacteriaceae bacterium AU392]|nr:ABC transporter permease [Flavobacteriaceae bacterium]RKM85109.1 FtsX-like permease family protein [Flavobacteriaceae bacterium AU392]
MKNKPPKIAQKLLRFFLKEDLEEEVLGDLLENYKSMSENMSKRKVKLNYWYQVLNYIRPFALKKILPNLIFENKMFRHDVLISLRSFKRYKGTFFINLIGLVCGICSAMFIYLWVHKELSFDKFHAKKETIYQVLQNAETAAGILTFEWTPALLAPTLKERFPNVEYATSVIPTEYFEETSYLINDNNYFEINEQFVDEDFLKVFSFNIIYGNENSLNQSSSNVLISESVALRLFGKKNVIGKVVKLQNEILEKDYLIGGVFKDVPSASSLNFNVLVNLREFQLAKSEDFFNWNNNNPSTYIALNESTDLNGFNTSIYNLVEQFDSKVKTKLFTQKLVDRYLYGNYVDGIPKEGRIIYIRLFALIGFVLLLIACINFMNLSTAKASTRLKELGVKKTLGASRWSLLRQYYTEAFLISLIASTCSLVLVYFTLPLFNEVTGSSLSLIWDIELILGLIGITLLSTIISGSYPAIYLSKLKTLASLSGRLSGSFSDLWVRRSLVIFQFSASIILIAGVLIINRQIDYIHTKNLGYDRDNVFYFSNDGIEESDQELLLNEINKISGVKNAAAADNNLTGNFGRTGGVHWPKQLPEEKLSFIKIETGANFIETMGIDMHSGRSFDAERLSDYTDKVILNQTAVKKMQLDNPVGTIIKLWGRDRQVIGVVKDFHALSLYEKIEPTLMIISKDKLSETFVKIRPGNLVTTINQIEDIYKKFSQGLPFKYDFVDKTYSAIYKGEKQVADLSKLFCAIAIIISCLGLMGLASFVSERRTKEIGIRKVLGSSNISLIKLLSSDFIRTISLAILLSIPISYYLSYNWVQNFAYAIEIKWWYFALVTLVTFMIFSLTVLSQILRVISAKAIDSLRCE